MFLLLWHKAASPEREHSHYLWWHFHREINTTNNIYITNCTDSTLSCKRNITRLQIFSQLCSPPNLCQSEFVYSTPFPFSDLKSIGCLSSPHKAHCVCRCWGNGLICVVQPLPLTERCLDPASSPTFPLSVSLDPSLSLRHTHAQMHTHTSFWVDSQPYFGTEEGGERRVEGWRKRPSGLVGIVKKREDGENKTGTIYW